MKLKRRVFIKKIASVMFMHTFLFLAIVACLAPSCEHSIYFTLGVDTLETSEAPKKIGEGYVEAVYIR